MRLLVAIFLLLSLSVAAELTVQDGIDQMLAHSKNGTRIVIVHGNEDDFEDFQSAAYVSSQIARLINLNYTVFPEILLAKEANLSPNMILVGGPCANPLTAQLLNGTGYGCADWKLDEGESMLKALDSGQIIVAGHRARDTLRAARSLGAAGTSVSFDKEEVVFSDIISISEALDKMIISQENNDDLLIVTSDKGSASDMLVAVELASYISEQSHNFPRILDASEIESTTGYNIITIGGPCSNRITESLLNEPGYNCNDWTFKGSLQKIVENKDRLALIIAGHDSKDTEQAVSSIISYKNLEQYHTQDEITLGSLKISDMFESILNDGKASIVVSSGEGDYANAKNLAEGLLRIGITAEIIDDKSVVADKHVFALGGPCTNFLAHEALKDTQYSCSNWALTSGSYIIQASGSVNQSLIVIAGTDANDTLKALESLLYNWSNMDSDLFVLGKQIEAECEGFLCSIMRSFSEEKTESVVSGEDNDYSEYMSAQNPNDNCYDCFLEAHGEDSVYGLLKYISAKKSDDSFEEAERRYLLGKITENQELSCSSLDYYKKALEAFTNPADQLTVYENLFFVASECNMKRESFQYMSEAVKLARAIGYDWKPGIYALVAGIESEIDVHGIEILPSLDVPKNAKLMVLGESGFEVNKQDIIVGQVERITRDWFSYSIDRFPGAINETVPYMEGRVLSMMLESSQARAYSAPNTIAVSKNSLTGLKWYAPDEYGIFRFEVLPDKIQYPTTKCVRNVCLIVDTHGISSLVPQAVSRNASIVIGCGDYYDKMEAAYYLAQKGINTIYPCDRFASEMLGYQGTGIALGSAPVKVINGTTVVGFQPIQIDIKEKIVVQTTTKPYPAQYYDAPYRYFTRLEELSGLNFDVALVDTPNLKETYKVVDEARKLGAEVIAARVAYEEDYDAVSAWLRESPEHRAVLFHTMAYAPGSRLMQEFPKQTTFGDPRPIFI